MNNTIANKLSTFVTALNVADVPKYAEIWRGKSPEHFGEGLEEVRGMVKATASKAAEQSAPITGDTEALRLLRTDLEKWLHVLARATFRALTRLERTEDGAKVDVTPSDLAKARAINLAGIGETVLDLAEPLSVAPEGGGEPLGKKAGITPALVARVDKLWADYGVAVGAPASARARRKALTGQIPNDARNIEAKCAELDDLVIQFADTAAGDEFVGAWFNARKVVDLGRRAAKPAPVPAPAPAPK